MALPSRPSYLLISLLCALLPFGCVERTAPKTQDGASTPSADQTPPDTSPDQQADSEPITYSSGILGRLGEPIGDCITIRGIILECDAGMTDLVVRVEVINGRSLKPPVDITVLASVGANFRSLQVGQFCEFEGLQIGEFIGTPPEAIARGWHSRDTRPFAFESEFLACRAASVSNADSESLPARTDSESSATPSNSGVPWQELKGYLGTPLGTYATVQGVLVEGFCKTIERVSLRVQRIDGKATQELIELPLPENIIEPNHGWGIEKVVFGATYEIEGFETGIFVGFLPECCSDLDEAKKPLVQGYNGYFLHPVFALCAIKQTSPVVYRPSDFVNETALIEGVAVSDASRSFIAGDGWRLLTDDAQPWPADIEGRKVEGYGVIRTTNAADVWRLEGGWTRLVNLEDQVGREVMLRASARGVNDSAAVLNYRGTLLYAEGLSETDIAKWRRLWFDPVVVRGRLEEAMLPDPRKDPGMNDPTLKKCYLVRNASFEPLDKLLSPEYPPKSTSSFDS